jgi:hypothetical protein
MVQDQREIPQFPDAGARRQPWRRILVSHL